MAVDRDVSLRIKADASQATREMVQLGQAAQRAKMDAEGWNNLGNTFDALQKRLERMGATWENTGRIGRFEVAALNTSLKELERQYGKNVDQATQLSEAERQVWRNAQADYQQAVVRMREYTAAQREVSIQTRQFTSLQGAIESLGGAWGQAALSVFSVYAAFKAGWEIGRELDKALEENTEFWHRWKDAATTDIQAVWDKLHGLKPALDFKSALAPQGPRGDQTGFLVNLGMAAQSLGVKTFGDYQQEFQRFTNQASVLQLSGGSLGTFLADHKKDVLEIIHGYELFGKEAPAMLVAVAKGWEAIDAQQKQDIEDQRAAAQAAREAAAEARREQAEWQKEIDEFDRLANKQLPSLPFTGRGIGTNAGNPFLPVGWDPDKWKQETSKFFAELDDAESAAQRKQDEERAKRWLQAAQDAADAFSRDLDEFAKHFADAFTDVLDGKGIADAAARMFKIGLHDALTSLGKDLGSFLAGSRGMVRVGDPMPGGGFFTSQSQVDAYNAQQGSNALAAGSSALNFAGGVYTAAHQQTPFLSSAISLGMTGAQAGGLVGGWIAGAAGAAAGGPIGLAVGVIAAAVISIINDQILPAVQKYAVPGITNGLATLNWTAGFNDAESKNWLQQIQKSFDTFKNGYAKIILSLPDDLAVGVMPLFADAMSKLASGSFNSLGSASGQAAQFGLSGSGTAQDPYRMRGGSGGAPTGGSVFQPQFGQPYGSTLFPSWNPDSQNPTTPAEWQNWMNLWINQQLPQAEMETFKNAFGQVFKNIGFTADAFQSLWADLERMDPKDALTAIGNIVSAFSEIHTAMGYFSQSGGSLLAGGFTANNQSFADQIAEADAQIEKFANGLQYLVGQDKIDAEKQLGDLMKQRQDSEKQFYRDLAAAIQNVRNSFEAMIRNYKLQDIPTTQGKEDFLRQRANDLLELIRHAPTQGLATQYGQEYADVINQMVQIGGNTAEWRKWAETQLKTGEDAVVDDLKRLGDAVAAQNKAFDDAMQKFIDAILHAADTINQNTGGTGSHPGGTGGGPSAPRGGDRFHKFDPWDWTPQGPDIPFGGTDNVRTGTRSASLHVYVNNEYVADVTADFQRRTLIARGRQAA